MSNPKSTAPAVDDQAFKQDLIELIPYLRAFARTLCRQPAAADDLAQDTLLKAWKSRDSFEPGTNLKAWTFVILRNQFYSQKRRDWRQAEWDEERAERSLLANTDQAAALELNIVRRALNQLPDDQREALILVGAGGFSYEETATVCGCAVGTVKSRVNRARKALEEILASGCLSTSDSDGVDAGDAMEAILDEAERIAGADAV